MLKMVCWIVFGFFCSYCNKVYRHILHSKFLNFFQYALPLVINIKDLTKAWILHYILFSFILHYRPHKSDIIHSTLFLTLAIFLMYLPIKCFVLSSSKAIKSKQMNPYQVNTENEKYSKTDVIRLRCGK